MSAIQARILNKPLSLEFTDTSQKALLITFLAWLIAVLYIYTSKKNYIAGKEYGTAKWGDSGEIRKLFADYLMKEEIKKTRKMRFSIFRFFMKRKIYKNCEFDGKKLKSQLLFELHEAEEVRRENGNANRRLFNESKVRINKEIAEMVKSAKMEEWEPDKLRASYQDSVQVIKANYARNLLNDKERDQLILKSKKGYRKSLSILYRGKGKIRAIKRKYKNADVLLTATEKISIYNYKLNNNTLILGGSGSGKTRGFVMPNILQAHSSYVITDPKGEVLEKSGYFLTKIKGYKLHVLNLDDKQRSDGYNPFVYIHPERQGYEERVLTLIETIIVNTDGGEKKGGSDPFWDKAERLFLQSIFFFTCDGFVAEERNMNTVLSLIGMLEIAEEKDNYDSDLDYFAKVFEKEHGSGHIGVEQFKEFRSKASGRTAKSIVISAVARLAPFRTSAVKKLFSYDTMQLDRLGEEKTAIFVVVPPTDTTFNFIAGMLFSQMFQELQYCASYVHKHDGQRLPVPVRFILDEFANTCTIPNFVKILAYARSFGIGIVPVLQSLEQIKNAYKDEWGVIVDNCSTTLFLGGIKHLDTLEYMSKLLGKGTFDKRTTGRSKSKQGSYSQNFDVIGRDLLDTSELQKIASEKCILIVGGMNPFYSDKYSYSTHQNYRYTSDGNHSYSFEYIPPEKPAKEDAAKDESTHREHTDFVTVLTPSENVKIDVEEIKMSTSYNEILNRFGRNFQHFMPVPDDLFNVDDGEDILSDEQADELLDLLSDKEDTERADRILSLSAESAIFLEKADADEIEPIAGIISTAAHLGRVARYLVPAPDECLSVDDGEIEQIDVQADIIFDDSGLQAGIFESEEMLGDVLNDLIDSLPPEARDTVLTGNELSKLGA